MQETHEILCPIFLDCLICDRKRKERNIFKILKFLEPNSELSYLSKHFYVLTIYVKPERSTYHNFSLDPLLRSGRELINGLSSLSSVSNRKWWGLYVNFGIRFFSVIQENENEFPTFRKHFLFYSEKDNLDYRMATQLKYRLKKINKHFKFEFEYLGKYDVEKIKNCISTDILIYKNSPSLIKLGEKTLSDINKLKDQKPICFGSKNKKSQVQISNQKNGRII